MAELGNVDRMPPTTRRRFLEAAGATTAGLCGCLTSSASHPVTDRVTDWPSFRGDRYNTGYARGVAPTSADPSIARSVDTDGAIWGSPAVVDGTVYIGSADGAVYAIDAASGEKQWAFPTDHRVEATPAVAEDAVFVGSYDEHLYAIDAGSGEETWSRALGGLIRGSPTVADGSVYVGVGCYNLACAWYADDEEVPENGWVYAFDAASGETEWQYEVGAEVVSTPAVVDGTAFIGASDGTLYALDAGSGDDEWTYEAGVMVWSAPAVAYGTVFVADWAGDVHAVDADSGDRVWQADPGGQYVTGSVAVDEAAVYVGNTARNPIDDPTTNYAKMFRFDRTDGEIEWEFETTATEIGSSPVVTDGSLYFGTHRQTADSGPTVGVYGLTTDGREEWFREFGGRGVGSSPALLEGTLYFGGTDGSVYALE